MTNLAIGLVIGYVGFWLRLIWRQYRRERVGGTQNVDGIIRAYLLKNGYDGLTDVGHCDCVIDDLFTHDGIYCQTPGLCLPGYKTPCACSTQDCGYHIRLGKGWEYGEGEK